MESTSGSTQTLQTLQFYAALQLGKLSRDDYSAKQEEKACPTTADGRAYVEVFCAIDRLEGLLSREKEAAADAVDSAEAVFEKVKQAPSAYANAITDRFNGGLLPVLHGLTVNRCIASNLRTQVDRLQEYYGSLDSCINQTLQFTQFTRRNKDGGYAVNEWEAAQKYYGKYQECMHIYGDCLGYLETEMLGKLKDLLGDISSRL